MSYKEFKAAVFSGGFIGTFFKLLVVSMIPLYNLGYIYESALNFARGGSPNNVPIFGNWGERFKNGFFGWLGMVLYNFVPFIGSLIGYTAQANFVKSNFNFNSYLEIGDVFKLAFSNIIRSLLDLLKIFVPILLVSSLPFVIPTGLALGLSVAGVEDIILTIVPLIFGLVLGVFSVFFVVIYSTVYYPYLIGSFIKEQLGIETINSANTGFNSTNNFNQNNNHNVHAPSYSNFSPEAENSFMNNGNNLSGFNFNTTPQLPADVIAYFNNTRPQLSGSYVRIINSQIHIDALNRDVTVEELLKLDANGLLVWNREDIKTKLYQMS